MMHAHVPSFAATAAHSERPASHRLTQTIVDQVDCGMAACDAASHLIWANRAAQREFESGRALTMLDGTVRCIGLGQAELRLAIRMAVLEQKGRLMSIGTPDSSLTVAIAPTSTNEFEIPVAMLIIGRRDVCSQRGVQMLATLHGLTGAEGRVLSALVASRSAREIAAAHGVSVTTVRTQIQSVRDKLRARSIVEVVLRAAQVPAM